MFNLSDSTSRQSLLNERYLIGQNGSINGSMNETTLTSGIAPAFMENTIYWRFSNVYRPIHGWLSTGVCLFGIPSNLLNIIVLTRPNMITSPTNLILTGLAFSDLFTMISSLVFGIYFYIVHIDCPVEIPSADRDTFAWTQFGKIHVMFTVTFHSISIWLTVYLACFRYIYIASSSSAACGINSTAKKGAKNGANTSSSSSAQNKQAKSALKRSRAFNYIAYLFQRCLLQCRTYNVTFLGIICICVFCIIFCFPAYLYPSVTEFAQLDNGTWIEIDTLNRSSQQQTPAYQIRPSYLDKKLNGLIFRITFYTQAILGKFIPCLLLVTFSSLLIHSLVVINRKNKRLNKSSGFHLRKKVNTQNSPSSGLTHLARLWSRLRAPGKHRQQVDEIQLSESRNLVTIDEATTRTSKLCKSVSLVPPENDRLSSVSKLSLTRRLSEMKFPLKQQTECKTSLTVAEQQPPPNSSTVNFNFNFNFNSIQKYSTQQQKQQLKKSASNNSSTVGGGYNPANNVKPIKRNKTKENLRTTLMLIIVCILFLITEFPQSILILFSIIRGESFYVNVYMPLGDLLDMLALINNSINFLLYCTMSRAFRNTFYSLVVKVKNAMDCFGCCYCTRDNPNRQSESTRTNSHKGCGLTLNKRRHHERPDHSHHRHRHSQRSAKADNQLNSNNFSVFTGNTAFVNANMNITYADSLNPTPAVEANNTNDSTSSNNSNVSLKLDEKNANK